MDSSKFTELIESEVIREYCQKLDGQFTAAQAAYIVYKNDDLLLTDRLSAWQEIIDSMPDCEFPGYDLEIGKIGAHDFLREYMAVQRKLMDMFFQTEENVIYTVCSTTFPDFDSAVAKAKETNLSERYVIQKRWKDTEKQLSAFFNERGEILSLFGQRYVLSENREKKIYHYMETAERNLSFPVPYKRGDILQFAGGLDGFVVDWINMDGTVYGYLYRDPENELDWVKELGGRELEYRFEYYASAANLSEFEWCNNEEKAERIRREFKALTARMQDIADKWE